MSGSSAFSIIGNVDINSGGAINSLTRLAARFNKVTESGRATSTTLLQNAKALESAARAAALERDSLVKAATAQEALNAKKRESIALSKVNIAKASAVTQSATDKTAIADAEVLLRQNKALGEAAKARAIEEEAASRVASRAIRDQIAQQRALLASQRAATRGVAGLATAYAELSAQVTKQQATAFNGGGILGNIPKTAALQSVVSLGLQKQKALADAAARAAAAQTPLSSGILNTIPKIQSLSTAVALASQKEEEYAARTRAASEAQKAAAASTSAWGSGLSRVAGVIGRTSAVALLGFGLIEAAGISGEHSIAQVARTTESSGKQVERLQVQFNQLANTLPVSFSELTKIGAAAGQLGIARENVADFTRVVAEFSATSNVSTDDAATAFGRLDALLPDVHHNYESLADSILNVGTRSIATEKEIIGIATQLASLGTQAGFSSKDLIGLSGALASIGAKPELARGTFTRLTSLISSAVSSGGDKLAAFAKVSGESADQFKADWDPTKDNGGQALSKFLHGLNSEGSAANGTLQALGINSVRDRPLLLRLANAWTNSKVSVMLYDKAIKDASRGESVATLSKQYTKLNNTVQSKLKVLLNNVVTLFRQIGSTNLGPLGDMIDGITHSLQGLSVNLERPVKLFGLIELPFTNAQALGTITMITGITAGIGLLIAGAAKLVSSFLTIKGSLATASIKFSEWRAKLAATTEALTAEAAAADTAAAANERVAATAGAATGAVEKQGAATAAAGEEAAGSAGKFAGLLKGIGIFAAVAAALEIGHLADEISHSSDNVDVLAAAFTKASQSGKGLADVFTSIRGNNLFGLDKTPAKLFTSVKDLKAVLDARPADSNWFTDLMTQIGAGAGTAQGQGDPKAVRDLQRLKEMAEAAGGALTKMGENVGFDKVAQSLADTAKNAKLSTSELDKLINLPGMADVKNGIAGVIAAKTGHVPSDKEIDNYILGLNKVKDTATKTDPAVTKLNADLADTGISVDDFSTSITSAYTTATDFNTIYQSTLDSVNATAKKKWVAAGHDVSTFVEKAKANLNDFLATADKAVAAARNKDANIAATLSILGPGSEKYMPQLESYDPQILQQFVDDYAKAGTAGGKALSDHLLHVLETTSPEAAKIITESMTALATDSQLTDTFQAWGGKLGKDMADSISKAFSAGDGSAGAQDVLDQQFGKIEADFSKHGKITIPIKMDSAPLRADYQTDKAYLEAQVIYAQLHGNTKQANDAYEKYREWVNNNPSSTTINADVAPARDKYKSLDSYITDAISYMTIAGIDIPARNKFSSTQAWADALQADITLFGINQPAINSGMSAKAWIDSLHGRLTIDGHNPPAIQAGESAVHYINRLHGTINVNANTDAARGMLNQLETPLYTTVYASVVGIAPNASQIAKNAAQFNATGGPIRGAGTGTSDSILSYLSNGEYVIRAAQARKYRALLDTMNYGDLPGYATGGAVYTGHGAAYEGTAVAVQSAGRGRGTTIQLVELSVNDKHLLNTIAERVGITLAPEHIIQATTTVRATQARRGNG